MEQVTLGRAYSTAWMESLIDSMAANSDITGIAAVVVSLVPGEPGGAVGVIYGGGILFPDSMVLASNEEKVVVVLGDTRPVGVTEWLAPPYLLRKFGYLRYY